MKSNVVSFTNDGRGLIEFPVSQQMCKLGKQTFRTCLSECRPLVSSVSPGGQGWKPTQAKVTSLAGFDLGGAQIKPVSHHTEPLPPTSLLRSDTCETGFVSWTVG